MFFDLAKRLFATTASLFLAAASAAHSADTLKVVYDEDFAPFSYEDENGKAAGLHVELVSALLTHAGIAFELEAMPWKRLVKMTDDNEVDISLPWRAKPERFELYHMIGPFTDSGDRTLFWTRADSPRSWNNFSDLDGQTIGARAGFSYAEAFEAGTNFQRTTENSDEILLKKLLGGRYDMVIAAELPFLATLKQFSQTGEIVPINGPAVDSTFRYFAVPKSKPELAEKLTQAFETFKSSPEYADIIARNLGN